MKTLNVFNSDKPESSSGFANNQENPEYRSNIILAYKYQLLIMADYPINPLNKSEQIERIKHAISMYNEPVALIAYDSSVITEKSQRNEFLQLVREGKLDIFLSQFEIHLNSHTSKTLLEENGIHMLEELTKWGKLFENYDEISQQFDMKSTPEEIIFAKRFTRLLK